MVNFEFILYQLSLTSLHLDCLKVNVHLLKSALCFLPTFYSSQPKNQALAESLQLLCCQSQWTFSLSSSFCSESPILNLFNHSSQTLKPHPTVENYCMRKTRDEFNGHRKRLINAISPWLLPPAHKTFQPPPGRWQPGLSLAQTCSQLSLYCTGPPPHLISNSHFQPGISFIQPKTTYSSSRARHRGYTGK